MIEADKESIGQVIVNLLDNALKFAFKRITIKIRIDKSKREKEEEVNYQLNENKKRALLPHSKNLMYIKMDVIYDESRIDEEISSIMFSKFNTKSDKGTEFGLFISKNIIDVHGGIIPAKNNYERKGAIISFRLPIYTKGQKNNNAIQFKKQIIELFYCIVVCSL